MKENFITLTCAKPFSISKQEELFCDGILSSSIQGTLGDFFIAVNISFDESILKLCRDFKHELMRRQLFHGYTNDEAYIRNDVIWKMYSSDILRDLIHTFEEINDAESNEKILSNSHLNNEIIINYYKSNSLPVPESLSKKLLESSSVKFYKYFSDEYTLMSLAYAIGLNLTEYYEYPSSIYFELHKNEKNMKQYIQVYYNEKKVNFMPYVTEYTANQQVNSQNLSDTKCIFDYFKRNMLRKILIYPAQTYCFYHPNEMVFLQVEKRSDIKEKLATDLQDKAFYFQLLLLACILCVFICTCVSIVFVLFWNSKSERSFSVREAPFKHQLFVDEANA